MDPHEGGTYPCGPFYSIVSAIGPPLSLVPGLWLENGEGTLPVACSLDIGVSCSHSSVFVSSLLSTRAGCLPVSHSLWIIGTTSYSSFLYFLRGGGSELGVLRLFHIVSDNS